MFNIKILKNDIRKFKQISAYHFGKKSKAYEDIDLAFDELLFSYEYTCYADEDDRDYIKSMRQYIDIMAKEINPPEALSFKNTIIEITKFLDFMELSKPSYEDE